VQWSEAVSIVNQAFSSFSATLGLEVKKVFDNGWVDAPPYAGKTSGAFNYSVALDSGARAYTFLNYQGSERDVMTLAHELGHAVHGLLAGEAVGPLMMHAPMAYAETASVFAEMLVFDHLRKDASEPRHELVLLMEKCSDFLSTVVRQVSFSVYEQKLHRLRPKSKISVEQFRKEWLKVTKEFYGKEKDLFSYKGMDYLWCYISHFNRPFYVYAYAFGELLTQNLYSRKEQLGDKFEPLYLALLRAGGTKDAIELLSPFGLDPREQSFWRDGIKLSVGKWLDRVEKLKTEIH
jgi:oligoendopeptidase F